VKCKIFYQRDYLDLLIKYGLETSATVYEFTAHSIGDSKDVGVPPAAELLRRAQ
jgi:hypothetical protein